MAQRTTAGDTTSYNAVFIDTSLDTRLATIVSSSDTVFDLKKKILLEHRACFPEFGEIKIQALKVRCRGHFYRLAETTCVKSLFDGFDENWFISVDASCVEGHNEDKQLSLNQTSVNAMVPHGIPTNGSLDGVKHLTDGHSKVLPRADSLAFPQDDKNENVIQKVIVGDRLGLDITEADGHCKDASRDANKRSDVLMQEEYDQYNDGSEAQITQSGDGDGNSRNSTGDVQGIVPLEGAPETESHSKKKHKNKKKRKSHAVQTGVVSHDDEVLGEDFEQENDTCKNQGVDMEDASPSEPAAKKKHKIGKQKGDECPIKENRILISDHNEDTFELPAISQHSIEDEPHKTLSTENLEGVQLQSACPSSGKRKRKKKSSSQVNQEISAASSPRKDAKVENSTAIMRNNANDLGKEPDAATAPGELVQGVPISDSCAVSRKEKHSDPVHDTDEDVRVSRDEKINLDAHQKPGTDQIVRVVEERESSQNNFPKPMPEERCKSSALDEIDMEGKEIVSKLLEVSDTADAKKSSKKKRKLKKTKDLVGGAQFPSDTGHVGGFVSDVSTEIYHAISGNHSSDKGNKGESNIPSKERKEVSEVDTGSTSILATDWEIDDVINNVVQSVNKITGVQVDTENVDGKSRKKSKKKRSSDPKNLPELQTENESSSHKGLAPATDNKKDVSLVSVESSQMNKITEVQVDNENVGGKSRKKSKKKRSSDQKNVPELHPANESSSHKGLALATDDKKDVNLVNVESSQIPQHELDGSIEGRNLLDIVDANPTKIGGEGDVSNHMQVSGENNRINFIDYFVPSQHQDETVASSAVIADKETEVKGGDSKVKVSKKKKKLDLHSNGPSQDLHSSLRSNENQRTKAKLNQSGNSSNIELENNEPLNISGVVKAIPSSKSDRLNSSLEEARGFNTVNPSGASTFPKTNKETGAAPNSMLESSKTTNSQNKTTGGHQLHKESNHIDNKRTSFTNIGEAVNSLACNKKLTADENERISSDATTRTPSDISFSSDYSDGESIADFNSAQSGSLSMKRKDGGGKNNTNLLSSGMSLDAILRSSSRYKKAKLAASQSQLDDSESQPVEFVPDSQANP